MTFGLEHVDLFLFLIFTQGPLIIERLSKTMSTALVCNKISQNPSKFQCLSLPNIQVSTARAL